MNLGDLLGLIVALLMAFAGFMIMLGLGRHIGPFLRVALIVGGVIGALAVAVLSGWRMVTAATAANPIGAVVIGCLLLVGYVLAAGWMASRRMGNGHQRPNINDPDRIQGRERTRLPPGGWE